MEHYPKSARFISSRTNILRCVSILCLVAFIGCGPRPDQQGKGNDGNKKDEKNKKEQAVPVELTSVTRGPIEEVIKASTNLEAEQEVKVMSRASNPVVKLLVEEGDKVKQGQLLVHLRDDEQKTAVAKAFSLLNQSKEEFKRTENLFKQDLISEKEFNTAKYNLEQLELSLEESQRQLDYTKVTAPITGTITSRLVKLGDQVNTGQHLFDIIDFDSIVARVYVPEKHLREISLDQPARIVAPSLGDKEFEGYVKRIAPIVDSQTGTVKITLGVRAAGSLRPGMFVDTETIVQTHPQALLVSKRSIVYDSDQMYVFRLGESNRVERALLEPLLTDKDNIEPVSGFKEGDQIVIAGQTGLKDKALVSLPGEESEENDEDEKSDDAEKKDGEKDAEAETAKAE